MHEQEKGPPKVLCLAWAPSSPRMDELSKEISAKRVNLSLLYGPMFLAPFRYLFLFLRTLILLASEGPDIVFAQNPAIFCPLTCLLYCKLRRKKLLIDHHCVWSVKTFSGTLLGSIIYKIECFVDRAADLNSAPHSEWGKMLARMGAKKVSVIYDYVSRNQFKRDKEIRKKYAPGFEIVSMAPHGGHPLERVESEVFAIAQNPRAMLLITGPREKMNSKISEILGRTPPPNVRFLGFLPKVEYERLKASSDFALSITDEPYTLSHALLEFAASFVPVISTRQKAVEELFGDSIIYVESSERNEVARRVSEVINNPQVLQDFSKRIAAKFEEMTAMHEESIRDLRKMIERMS
jgi:glycosyltransferase involved in cell wall biosynthesis